MGQATNFEKVLGAQVRARRAELGRTQDEVARRLWMLGFSFTRSVIDAVERGTRELTLPELAALLAVLDMSLEDLRGVGQVTLGRGVSVPVDTLLEQLLGGRRTWNVTIGSTSAVVNPSTGTAGAYGSGSHLQRLVGTYGDAEMKAARKLDVSPDAIAAAADELWGRSLTEERDARVREQAPQDASTRTLQALRGHVTRALLEELLPQVRPQRRARRKKP